MMTHVNSKVGAPLYYRFHLVTVPICSAYRQLRKSQCGCGKKRQNDVSNTHALSSHSAALRSRETPGPHLDDPPNYNPHRPNPEPRGFLLGVLSDAC